MNPTTDSGFLYPFGEVSCEQELEVLQEHYYEYFYDQSPFNEEVLDPEIYLIVGRRGSGKTSLTKYFGFQKVIKNCHSVDVDEPVIYNNILHRIEKRQYQSTDLAVNEVRNIWEYLIWSLIFNQYCELDPAIKRASLLFSNAGKPAQFFQEVVKGLINKYVGDDGVINDELAMVIHGTIFTSAKEKVIEFSRKEPVIVAVDTFERYDRENTAMMIVTASLIQFASDMNISYARKGIYIKIFVSSEIFPYVKESVISNTIKYIRDPLYLLWRPKDLIRLVSWRLHKHLSATGHSFAFKDIDWENFDEVRNKMWYPFFGKTIQNMRGMSEESFPYILRHIQMRPRQLVAELGIVGRVRKQDEKTGIIAADFEYNMHDRLTLNSDDLCAIHPMFYYKLQVRKDEQWIVYPFPDHTDYEEM